MEYGSGGSRLKLTFRKWEDNESHWNLKKLKEFVGAVSAYTHLFFSGTGD